MQTYLPYWKTYPRGSHVTDAVTRASRRMEYAARFCPIVAGGELSDDPDRIRDLVGSIRESLIDVAVEARAELLAHLAEIERTCLGRAINLKVRMQSLNW